MAAGDATVVLVSNATAASIKTAIEVVTTAVGNASGTPMGITSMDGKIFAWGIEIV